MAGLLLSLGDLAHVGGGLFADEPAGGDEWLKSYQAQWDSAKTKSELK